MAMIRRLEPYSLEVHAKHRDSDATYSVIIDASGRKYLQIDTYGSKERKFLGKKSQSIRLAPEALAQLRRILDELY